MFTKKTSHLNIFNRCSKYYVKSIWQCPEFLFFIFGIIIISAIIITNFLAKTYAGPELAAVLSIIITIPLIIIAYSITKSFEYLAVASEMKSEFIKIMSHQLRAPLVAIKWQLESFLSKIGEKKDEEASVSLNKNSNESGLLIKSIQKQNDELLKLINKFLALKRIEENNFILNKENFSISDLIKEIVNSKNSFFDSNPVSIKNEGEKIFIKADKDKIRIVLDNIIENALKYSPEKKEVEIFLEKTENDLKIIVSDNGLGIKKTHIKNIFQKFIDPGREFVPLTSEQIPGLGIGLYLSKKIIESHKGKIGFETKEGEGSTFWFTLPIS